MEKNIYICIWRLNEAITATTEGNERVLHCFVEENNDMIIMSSFPILLVKSASHVSFELEIYEKHLQPNPMDAQLHTHSSILWWQISQSNANATNESQRHCCIGHAAYCALWACKWPEGPH